MKSIRIKVKTLIIIALCAIFSMVYADEIYYQGIKLINVFIEEDIEYAHLRSATLDSEMSRLSEIYKQHDYELFNLTVISDGMMASSARVRQVDALNILETFRIYEEDVFKKGYYDYMFNVILAQWFSGNVDTTLQLLDEVPLDQLNEHEKDHYYLIKLGISMTYYDLEEVEGILGKISKNYDHLSNYIKNYMAVIYDYDITYEEAHNSIDDDLYMSFFDELIQGVRSFNEESTRTISGSHINITGQVTINGQPVEGAMVYGKGYDGFSSYEAYSKDFVLTDAEGNYELKTKDGILGYGIKLPWQLIHDKRLERKWDQTYQDGSVIDMAFTQGIKFKSAYFEDDMFIYEIDDPSDNNTYYMNIKHADPSYYNEQSYIELESKTGRIPMEKLHQATRSRFGLMTSDDILDIEYLTEPLYLSGDYLLTVNVKRDNHIYSSNGIFSDALDTYIYYEGVDYNAGDLLIKKDRIEEAIVWYKDHPTRHNLKVLVALFTYGTEAIDGEYEQELIHKRPQEALVYLKKLIELDGQTEQRLYDLSRLYSELCLYEKAETTLETILLLNDNVYNHVRLGVNKIMNGKYSEGIEYLLEYGDIENEGDRYYDYFILGNQLDGLPLEIKEGIESNDQSDFEEMYKFIQTGAYEAAYNHLTAQEESDFKTFYQLMFLDAFNFDYVEKPYEKVEDHFQSVFDFTEYYRVETEKMSNQTLKDVLMFLKEGYHWFGY